MRRTAIFIASMLMAWFAAGAAQAHAEFESMTPASGAVVTEAPQHVTLTFGEDVQAMGTTVVVLDPSGHNVQTGDVSVSGPAVTQAINPLTDAGVYHVNFRVVSADGHVVTGSETFDYEPPTLYDAAPSSEATSVPETSPIKEASSTAGYYITAALMGLLLLVAAGVMRHRRS